MNFIPFVLAFLIFISIGTHAFLQKQHNTIVEQVAAQGAMSSMRQAENLIAQHQYDLLREKKELVKADNDEKPVSKSKRKEENTSNTWVSRRDKKNIINCEGAKFNLAALFKKKELSSDPLYHTAARFLKLLYEGNPLISSSAHFEYQILDELIAIGKEKEIDSFNDLIVENSVHRDVIFRMLKGTQEYEIGTDIGYPPLEHFFTLDSKRQKKALYFSFASNYLLTAVFGEKIATEINDLEKMKKKDGSKTYTLTKQELCEFLRNKHSQAFSQEEIDELFNFSKKQPAKKAVYAIDDKTDIRAKQAVLKSQS